MFDRIWVVFAKETIDNLRDWRSVSGAMIYPFIGPILIGILIGLVGKAIVELPKSTFQLAIVGAERAPGLIDYLHDRGVEVIAPPADPKAAVRGAEHDTVLVVPEAYAADFAAERPAEIVIVSDGSRLSAVLAMSRALTLLRAYGIETGAARLRARGVDPVIVDAIEVRNVNVAVGRSLSGFFLNMMPPLIIFTVFVGGMYLAIDATSGERERGSLEPLLTNPIARWELMAGKVGAALLFTAAAVAVQLAAFMVMFEFLIGEAIGMRETPSILVYLGIFVLALPLMLFAVALQSVIAAVTRSFKETQTYLALLPLVPSVPGLVFVFIAIKAHAWMMTIPTLSQTVLIGQVMRGEPLSALNVAIASVVTTACALGLLAIAVRLYRREALLLGG